MCGLPEHDDPDAAAAAKIPLAQCGHTLTLGITALADRSSLDYKGRPTLVQVFDRFIVSSEQEL